jgi:hypothetical protein
MSSIHDLGAPITDIIIASQRAEISDLKKNNLTYQLFVGKVADLIGISKAAELLAQAKTEIKQAKPCTQ